MARPIAEYRRPEIVAATLRAIREHGLPMPSYDRIAQHADMSRQLIRHYFPDPERLMVAVCDTMAASYREALMKGIIQTGRTERLPLFLDFYFNFLADKGLRKPEDDAVYDAMFSLAQSSEIVRKTLVEQYSELRQTIAQEVQVSYPELSQKACREIGFLFVSLMYGHWKMVATLGFSTEYNAVTRQALDRIIASYRDHYIDPDDSPAPLTT